MNIFAIITFVVGLSLLVYAGITSLILPILFPRPPRFRVVSFINDENKIKWLIESRYYWGGSWASLHNFDSPIPYAVSIEFSREYNDREKAIESMNQLHNYYQEKLKIVEERRSLRKKFKSEIIYPGNKND